MCSPIYVMEVTFGKDYQKKMPMSNHQANTNAPERFQGTLQSSFVTVARNMTSILRG
jgi:hypothetical protein